MNKRRAGGLLWLVFSMAFAAAAVARSLDVAVEDAAAPWSNADGRGFANDVVRAAFAAVGVEARFQVVPYARCKQMVMSGEIAACFSMSPFPDAAESLVFSHDPLFVCRADYFQNLRNPQPAKREFELRPGVRVGIVRGYEYPPSLTALKSRGVIFEATNSEVANLRKLADGRIDFALINHNAVKSIATMKTAAGVHDEIAYAFESGLLKSYIGFSIRHPSGDWARRKFDEGYRRIAENGELKAIETRWADAELPK